MKIKKMYILIALCVSITIGAVLSMCLFINSEFRQVFRNTKEYKYVLGTNGKFKTNYIGYNNIFPDELPQSAKVKKFYYEYFHEANKNFLGYLEYDCNEKDYKKEYKRLKKIGNTDCPNVYGTKKFPYKAIAVKASSKYGMIYALADEKKKRFIYVDLQFLDYYMDVNYKKIVPNKYLPIGFEAGPSNQTRLKKCGLL